MSTEDYSANVCQYFRPKTVPTPSKRSVPKESPTKRSLSPTKKSLSSLPKTSRNDNDMNRNNVFDSTRRQLFDQLVDQFDGRMTAVRDQQFRPLMDSLFTFVSNNCLTNHMREHDFKTRLVANVGLIPTALLSIGMNSSDHKFICDLLVDTIQDLSSVVVYLNCSLISSMSLVFKAIADQILTADVIENAGLDDQHIKRLTFGPLFKIYEDFVVNTNANNFCPPIVLFLDDIESCNHQLVTNLILILKEYMENIAFILIVSKSNETTSLQHLLPSSATDYLIVHHFQTVSCRVVVDEILRELFIDSDSTYKLGSTLLDFTLKMFAKFDFSVQNIRHIIRYSLFLHFFTNELSFLSQTTKHKLKKYLKTIDARQLKTLRDSGLFGQKLNDKDLNRCVINKMTEFITTHQQFVNKLKIVLQFLNESDIRCPVNLVKLYVNALNTSYEFTPVLDSLMKLSQTQWLLALETCLSDSELRDGIPKSMCEMLTSRLKELQSIADDLPQDPQPEVEKAVDTSDLKAKFSKFKTRSQWKETIKPINKPKLLSKFDVWKSDTIDCIERELRDVSAHPLTNPLSKVLFLDAIDVVKPRVLVDQRLDLQKCLSFPLSDGSDTDFHTMYAMFAESPAVINMYDWFESFRELTKPLSKSPTKKAKPIAGNSDETIVRFLNSVSDFEYMGLLEPSKRKTDHLNRLVWF